MKNLFPKPQHEKLTPEGVLDSFTQRLHYSVGKDEHTARDFDLFTAFAYTVRDRLMERWFATQDVYYQKDAKRVYYLSLEFLIGRLFGNNLLNLGSVDEYGEAARRLGLSLANLEEQEWDAGLGNGGLGRLAACFLDSAASLALPFYGYGIRYEYGIFHQHVQDGMQVEAPDNWLRLGNPWEVPRTDALFPVKFYGRTEAYEDETGFERIDWVDTQDVWAMAYDTPVIGFRNGTVNTLRLWAARSSREFDLLRFNSGDYVRAVEDKTATENISKVLYPSDDVYAGKELRLKQQYFFASATLQDVIRRFLKKEGRRWEELPDQVAIQLNDTHPSIAVPELMRVLVDLHRVDWEKAWSVTQRVFGYTNHTILAEALESWPTELFSRLLPRHLQIVQEIDRRLRAAVLVAFPDDTDRARRMAVVDPDSGRVRMSHLAIVGSHAVNGVAKLHTQILKSSVFRDFDQLYPGKFSNKTNGITPRRWLLGCNPGLSSLITDAIGNRWLRNFEELRSIEPLAGDAAFREKWRQAKLTNKQNLMRWSEALHGLSIDPETVIDCQVKRIHEYKRQLLNVMHVIALYHRIRDGAIPTIKRTFLFAGKAAPSYTMAKLIIRLIHAVGKMIDADPVAREFLRVVFIPNYGVSAAEKIFPACEISEQISTAGMEASGTGNMKAALNGALTVGTMDGANIEICDAVGVDNMFIFGSTAADLTVMRSAGYDPALFIARDAELARVLDTIDKGELDALYPGVFKVIADSIRNRDTFFHCADFRPYLECHERAAADYLTPELWTAMSIRNVARMSYFSSDRTVAEYARDVWDVEPVPSSGSWTRE
ncbi:MAG TPA: glycogen/starch/alpha-glucan phosphorylase [Thermoanaerobaculia bacterium]|nr:glycogen/starch/alpha-glucan phosphorylase [Thermoanaerobaculia bacterium]